MVALLSKAERQTGWTESKWHPFPFTERIPYIVWHCVENKKGTTQIDHIVVSKYGIIAIETKNYRGNIYGDDNRKEWTQLIVTKVTFAKKWWKTYTYVTKKHFYNPVKQSAGHALKIKELLTAYPHVKIVPIVVFTGEAVLNNVKSNHHVIYEDKLLEVISGYKATYLTDNDVQTILTILNENNIRESVSDRQHIKNIQATAREVNETIKQGVCPRCGGHLIERRGKYGTFYGCSNYPQCRFTVRQRYKWFQCLNLLTFYWSQDIFKLNS